MCHILVSLPFWLLRYFFGLSLTNITFWVIHQCHVLVVSCHVLVVPPMSSFGCLTNVTFWLSHQCHVLVVSPMSCFGCLTNVMFWLSRQCHVLVVSPMSCFSCLANVTFWFSRQMNVMFWLPRRSHSLLVATFLVPGRLFSFFLDSRFFFLFSDVLTLTAQTIFAQNQTKKHFALPHTSRLTVVANTQTATNILLATNT